MSVPHLRAIGFDELMVRGRQGATKWLERQGLAHPARASGPRVAEGRFFDGSLECESRAAFGTRMDAAREDLLSAARLACRRQFDLLGYTGLSFGEPIDWHLDPVSGRRAPMLHWSRINPLDTAVVGDAKVVWELNRHQWLVRLAQAYRLDGDQRFSDVFAGEVRHWLDTNPVGMGINWASSLEVALRVISWCWCLHLFRGAPAMSPALRNQLVNGIGVHAGHIERYLSYYVSPNTHLTGEALGLFYAGVLFPDLPRASRWRELGARILVEQCECQVLGDGVYFEQATGYERYTLEIYLHFLILSARNGLDVPPSVTDGVHRMLTHLLAVRLPDGSMPLVGDADSGSVMPLAPRAQTDFRGVFAVAAALLGRSDCAWAAGDATPEVVWMLGPSGLADFDRLNPAPPVEPPSRCLAEGGYVVMQDGWGAHRHQLTFDVGPLGCPVTSGHGHADLLSVQCAAFGEAFLIDPGTFSYSDASSRIHFRGTSAHSTVMVDDEPQTFSTGPFRWSEKPSARLRQWQSTRGFDYADAEHSAYQRLAGLVAHRRRIVFVKPRYWVILDDLTGSSRHRVDLRFQCAPITVSLDKNQRAIARRSSGHALLIQPFSTAPLSSRVVTGCLSPMQGWVSREYGQREPAPVVVYSTAVAFPIRILTVLMPLAPAAPPPAMTPVFDADAGATLAGVAFDDGESVTFDDFGVRLAPGWGFSHRR